MPDSRNVNALWSGVFVETLARLGLRRAVVSPGSRSAPLVFALAQNADIESIPVLDERSAAFFALGMARRERRPVLLLCTSGTAGANYYPAIVEAQESGTPLLVVTADRPPEMRACASGQTIDQQKFYGDHVNFYHELAMPEANGLRLRYLRQTVAHAWARALSPQAGPVHLDAPFRDPLAPVPDGTTAAFAEGIDWERFFAQLAPQFSSDPISPVPSWPSDSRGVIIAGPAQPPEPDAYAAAVGEIARKLGWPVLADGLSPVRHRSAMVPNLITAYDAILRNPESAQKLRPEAVICLEDWPTSKVLRGWLEDCDAPTWLAGARPVNRDSLHGRTRHLCVSAAALAAGLLPARPAAGYPEAWGEFERKARTALDESLRLEEALFEPKAAWLLAQRLPKSTPVFTASSMPVRDSEWFWPANDRGIRPFFNRGANGIDGTVATALGVAHGGAPAVLLTGDLALLHDAGSLLLRAQFRGGLTIVLINNRGGGIFEHLPVAQFEPPFERFFATPQEADFEKLCSAFGVGHVLVRDWPHFTELIADLPAGIRVLEVRTDRKRDAARRKAIFAAVSH
jgi:2-succinyl-5-enolpyruvyl-6-hydroxy-3-cyclohexene-1-carboxylate synthase